MKMAPHLYPALRYLYQRSINITSPTTTIDYIGSQWINPSDIFSILLLLGPEIVQHAVAQLAGHCVTPVAFSFGWVAYSAKALLAVFGDGLLMPEVGVSNVTVIGVESGHIRITGSWVLGKLLSFLNDTVDEDMSIEQSHIPPDASSSERKIKDTEHGRPWEALRISVFETIDDPKYTHGVPIRDAVWYSGYAVIILQLIIAVIPIILHREWGTLFITVYGNTLALLEGSLTQWKEEKWPCPRSGGSSVILTQGNGTRHACLILGAKGVGLDLEILAVGTRRVSPSLLTRLGVAILTVNWIILLITAAGLQLNTWYLFGIGVIGSIQNLVAAGLSRSPSALGVHIRDTQRPIRGPSVKQVLKEAEELYPGVGVQMAQIFYPGSMRVQESEFPFWREAQDRLLGPNKWGTRIDRLPPPVAGVSHGAADEIMGPGSSRPQK
ncbi:hypothetical protein TWF694_007305 [Orbilia ellipsospora]|uniref:Uncharacterized protein n=1 Tax=Orbilia ellipsospora TaxID=2528407 RepID=A0AAV9XIS7_9PEZI